MSSPATEPPATTPTSTLWPRVPKSKKSPASQPMACESPGEAGGESAAAVAAAAQLVTRRVPRWPVPLQLKIASAKSAMAVALGSATVAAAAAAVLLATTRAPIWPESRWEQSAAAAAVAMALAAVAAAGAAAAGAATAAVVAEAALNLPMSLARIFPARAAAEVTEGRVGGLAAAVERV